jgi:hypothetical protein
MSNDKENKGKVDKEKLDKLKKERDQQTGIPIENENVSSDPNRTPAGDDRDKNVSQHPEDYVEPYNKKKFHNDKKTQKPPKK